MRFVTLLCKPPLLLISLFIIHDAAEPQVTKMISFRADAQLFQKCSNACIKRAFGVSNQGSSSIKITFFSAVDFSKIPQAAQMQQTKYL